MEIFIVLTDTDSTSLTFIFISDPNSEIPASKYRDIIFEIITSSHIYKRFDSSHKSRDILGARKEKKNKLGYYEIEHIDNPCILMLTVNPKEYLELFEDKNINKKHKDTKKGSSGFCFKNFAQRIGSLINFHTFEKPPPDTKKVSRLTVLAGEKIKSVYVKNKFFQINDKRFYFPKNII